MADQDVEQAAVPESAPKPSWRAHLAAWGAVLMVLLGAVLGTWTYFRWEETVHLPLLSSPGAKILAVVLVFTGGALLAHLGARTKDSDDTNDAKDH